MPNLADHLFARARECGGKIALWFGGVPITFADLARRVSAAAAALADAGVTIGTRVGLLLPASPDFIIFQQALFTLGATPVPLNTQYLAGEVEHAIRSCGLQVLIAAAELIDRVPEPDERDALCVIVPGPPVPGRDTRFRSIAPLDTACPPVAKPVDLPENAVGLMLCTSATTGRARGVELTIGNIRANYDRTPGWLGLSRESVILCALPLYNTFALNQCINATLALGATLVLLPRFDAAACLDAIATHRCTFLPAVPTMLQWLLERAEATSSDLSSVERVMTGGAPVPASLLERIRRAMRPDTVVLTGYGLTEGTALVTLDEIEVDDAGRLLRPKSIGRVLPGMELRVADGEGRSVEPRAVGELLVRGPNLMKGYFGLPAETAEAIADSWLRTGDLGYLDEDRYAYIVDRKKDIIIRGGQNIYPADVEEVLYALPDICEAAVIGIPDDDYGELPIGYVSLHPGGRLSSEDMIAHCRAHLARFKVPAAIHLLPELPKGPTGKIIRRGLRDMAVASIADAVARAG